MRRFYVSSVSNKASLENFSHLISTLRIPKEHEEEYIEIYRVLISLRVESIPRKSGGIKGSLERLQSTSMSLNQVYLHRLISLYEGVFYALATNNYYLVALSMRALFETTAALGYLYNRLNSYSEGNIESETLDDDLMILFLGTKDKLLQESNPYEPKNVMKMLDFADKIFVSKFLKQQAPSKNMLREIYEWLCEYCHPNFHSTTIACQLDKKNQQLNFNHFSTLDMRKTQIPIIEPIIIGTKTFVHMYYNSGQLIDALKK
ncbi:hypothetical protein [Vibrio sp. Vb0598]|uniref:hypothetical protein n=1 Tax=Vibrio sp. Vb0598 TaxID=3074627 RepID=UPI002964B60C|nr:hypothetical protein [Vibrio sp. Vb0598]